MQHVGRMHVPMEARGGAGRRGEAREDAGRHEEEATMGAGWRRRWGTGHWKGASSILSEREEHPHTLQLQ